ncbi:helix-turn-helix transcriptional regulator [Actinoallomurus sp. NPDC052274]|uniref:helix-turn-helix domain-containing protein n=1 Tax=Actinoallomurus sp. NPDC052274 TaxID=3155420 RepID=UPI00344725A2
MPDGREPSPTVRRRRLAAELRRLREDRGLTASEVAKQLTWGDSKPLYLESGQGVRPDPNDVRLLCGLYGVTGAERDELIQFALDGRLRGWWHPYRKMLSRTYTTYIGLEAEAAEILSFEESIFPGLLQTEDYTRALIIGAEPPTTAAAEIESRVSVRVQRQRILDGAEAARLWAVIDESVIRRTVGGPDVMRAQLEHLLKLMERPNITVQVMPFSAGAHAAVASSFTVLRFTDSADAPATYVETIAGELFVEEPSEVTQYEEAFERLKKTALGETDTIAVVAAAAATI